MLASMAEREQTRTLSVAKIQIFHDITTESLQKISIVRFGRFVPLGRRLVYYQIVSLLKYTYVVTSLNRLHNESKGVKKKVKF